MHNGNNYYTTNTTNDTTFFHVPKKPPNDPVHADLIRACGERALAPRLHRLLGQGANVDHRDEIECTPLHHAVFGGSVETVRAMVDAGADPNSVNDWYGTPLCLASLRGNLEIVEYLIEKHADVNKDCGMLGSAAHAACVRGDLPIMRALHTADASWRAKRSICVDAFRYSSKLSQDNRSLLAYQRSLKSQRCVQSPGAMAVRFRNSEAVKFCLGLVEGLSANEPWNELRDPSNGKGAITLLMLAMSDLDVGTAESLLEHGANVRKVDDEGRGALIYALQPFEMASTNAADLGRCVRLILRHGVRIDDFYDIQVRSSFSFADVPRLLWVSRELSMSYTTLMIVGSVVARRACEDTGSRPPALGMTALMYILDRYSDPSSRVRCVKVLCKHGADVRLRGRFNRSALDFAHRLLEDTKKDEIIQILTQCARQAATGCLASQLERSV